MVFPEFEFAKRHDLVRLTCLLSSTETDGWPYLMFATMIQVCHLFLRTSADGSCWKPVNLAGVHSFETP